MDNNESEMPATFNDYGPKTSAMAKWSFIFSLFGILSIFGLYFGLVALSGITSETAIAFAGMASIFGLIFGIIARIKISNTPQKLKGGGWGTAGILLSIITACIAFWLIQTLRESQVRLDQSQCNSFLHAIGNACYSYMEEFEGKMPPRLEILVETEFLVDPECLVCPCTDDKIGDNSYVYLGAGLDRSSQSSRVVAYDKGGNHRDGSRNVLFMDGRVGKFSEEEFKELIDISKYGELKEPGRESDTPF